MIETVMLMRGCMMCPEDLAAAECAVYAAAFGAEFSRALAFYGGINTASLMAGGWGNEENTFTKHARELEDAKKAAYYVAEQAVISFRSACSGVLGEPRTTDLDIDESEPSIDTSDSQEVR